jgi:pyrimidine deaminase RibD-like protein
MIVSSFVAACDIVSSRPAVSRADYIRGEKGGERANPMVGAILVRGGEEVSHDWHARFGFPRAEVEALSAAKETGRDPRGSTLYVSLEPCLHIGKTPPGL